MSAYEKITELPKDELITLINSESSKVGVLKRLGIAPNHRKCGDYLRRFISDNAINIDHMSAVHGLEHRFSREEVEAFVKQSQCWSDAIRASGRQFYGNMIGPFKRLVKIYEIDTSHFDSKKAAVTNKQIKPRTLDEIFCEHSTVARAQLKRYIIESRIIEYVCQKCGNSGEWMNQPLVLQIEHINGIRNDHRLENLCFLCGNCHSQTPTYAGRNWKKENRL